MRLVAIIIVSLMLFACVSAPKDYSSAKELDPIDSRLKIKSLWVKKTGAVPLSSSAQLKPAITDNRLYVASVNGDVGQMDASDGKWLWRVSLGEELTSGIGVGQSSIIVGSRNAEIISLNRITGSELWRTGITSEMLATPVVVGNSIYVQTVDGKITSFDINTGNIEWSYSHDIPKLTLRGSASPIISGNQLIAGFADGSLVSLDAHTGEINWKATITVPRGRTDLERLADIDGLFQASNGNVYVTSYQGRVASVSLTDGNIQWAREMSSYVGLLESDGHIYICDTEGKIWALDARTGATLWRQDNLIGREVSSPAIVEGAIVVADYDGYIHWLSLDDGQFIARASLNKIWNDAFEPGIDSHYAEPKTRYYPRLVTIPPLAVNNVVYVRDNTGAFAAIQAESKKP